MGTRSLTVLHEGNKTSPEICVMYRQYDGYVAGHGMELADFLKGIRLVIGISGDETQPIANGMECLAAQVVAHFKTRIGMAGGIYLFPPDTRGWWEEYIYHVYEDDGQIRMSAEQADGVALYDGAPDGLSAEEMGEDE